MIRVKDDNQATPQDNHMAAINATQAQAHFSELIARVGESKERVVIEQDGQAIAAVVSYEDLQRLEAVENARDVAELRQAMVEAQQEGFVTLEAVIEGYNALYGTDFTLESLADG